MKHKIWSQIQKGLVAVSVFAGTLAIVNVERQDRGLVPYQLDASIMSQVSVTHSQEMQRYGYFEHTSPINMLGNQSADIDVSRLTVNPVFAKDFFGENIAQGFTTAAASTFGMMYADSRESWGHRGAFLQPNWRWIAADVRPTFQPTCFSPAATRRAMTPSRMS